jgi:DNA-binding beta-propeller fold protein YncE
MYIKQKRGKQVKKIMFFTLCWCCFYSIANAEDSTFDSTSNILHIPVVHVDNTASFEVNMEHKGDLVFQVTTATPIAEDLAGEIAIVTLSGSGEVAFISIEREAVLKTVQLGVPFPGSVAVTPDGRTAVVTSESGYICFVDVASIELVRCLELLSGPEQDGITLLPNEFADVFFTPDGRTALITEGNEIGQLFFVDMETMELSGEPLNVGDSPSTVIIKSSGSEAYVLDDGNIHVVNLPERSFVTFSEPLGTDEVSDFAITPDESRAIFIDEEFDSIFLLDTNTWGILDQKQVNEQRSTGSNQVAVSPDGTMAIVTNGADPSITFVTIGQSSLTIDATIEIGGTANGVSFTQDGETAVVTLANTSLVKIIDVANRQIKATISERLGLAPNGVTIVDIAE